MTYTPSFSEHNPVIIDNYVLRKNAHTYLVEDKYVHIINDTSNVYQIFNNDNLLITTARVLNNAVYVSDLSNQTIDEYEQIKDKIEDILSIEALH